MLVWAFGKSQRSCEHVAPGAAQIPQLGLQQTWSSGQVVEPQLTRVSAVWAALLGAPAPLLPAPLVPTPEVALGATPPVPTALGSVAATGPDARAPPPAGALVSPLAASRLGALGVVGSARLESTVATGRGSGVGTVTGSAEARSGTPAQCVKTPMVRPKPTAATTSAAVASARADTTKISERGRQRRENGMGRIAGMARTLHASFQAWGVAPEASEVSLEPCERGRLERRRIRWRAAWWPLASTSPSGWRARSTPPPPSRRA
jgi:hypothetical protein